MIGRAKSHPNQTKGMRKAIKIFQKWLDWYHKNAPDCIAYPLIATPDTTKDLGGTYTANLQFNITFTKPEVYVFVSKFLFPLNLIIQMMSSL